MAKGWLRGLAFCVCAGCAAEPTSQDRRDTTQARQADPRPAVTFAPSGRNAAPLVLTVTMTPVSTEQGRPLPDTKPIELLLVITDNANGRVRGAIASGSPPGLPLTEVSGTLSGDRLQLTAGEIALGPGTSLHMRSLQLSSVSRSGTATGFWQSVTGDVSDQVDFTAAIAIATDTEGRAASFGRGGAGSSSELSPADAVEIRIGEPVDARKLEAIKVVTDGKALVGALEIASPVAGLANSARFTARGFLPPRATLALDVAGLTDTVGHPITWDGAALTTGPDAGPLTTNGSFEDKLRGWRATGDAVVSGSFGGVDPADGDAQVIVRPGSSLSGYINVPRNATELSMSLTVFSEGNIFDAGRSVVVSLASEDGARTVIFDGAFHTQHDQSGTFGEFRHRIGPRIERVDLKRYRGQRVTLTADVRSSGYIGVNYFALVLDDVRVK